VSYIEVDPQRVASTGSRLRDAVDIAVEVATKKGELASLADDAGHGDLTGTVHEFMDKWAHGLGCLTQDAEKLARLLADSGAVYIDLETSIADACGPGAPGGPR
jgi:hypothetical protein